MLFEAKAMIEDNSSNDYDARTASEKALIRKIDLC